MKVSRSSPPPPLSLSIQLVVLSPASSRGDEREGGKREEERERKGSDVILPIQPFQVFSPPLPLPPSLGLWSLVVETSTHCLTVWEEREGRERGGRGEKGWLAIWLFQLLWKNPSFSLCCTITCYLLSIPFNLFIYRSNGTDSFWARDNEGIGHLWRQTIQSGKQLYAGMENQ